MSINHKTWLPTSSETVGQFYISVAVMCTLLEGEIGPFLLNERYRGQALHHYSHRVMKWMEFTVLIKDTWPGRMVIKDLKSSMTY